MRETLEWIDVEGTVRRFNVEPGVFGRFMPPVEVFSTPLLTSGGGRVGKVRDLERVVMFPTWVEGDTDVECHQEIRDWILALHPSRGAGVIRCTAPDGAVRELYECFYTGGWEGSETLDMRSRLIMRAVPSFKAMDPYWYDPVGIGDVFVADEPPLFFPGPPFSFGSSAVIGDGVNATNPGDVESWPVWTIEAPFTNVIVENVTTGKTMYVDVELATGWLTIDTRTKDVRDDGGNNLYGAVASNVDSSMWSFAPGANELNITATGSQAGVTQIRYVMFPRYLTP